MTSTTAQGPVAIVGAGAAGALVALQLCETAVRRHTPLELLLIDPAPEAGRGTAYATRDPRHLLNVPAGDMSCYPDDPGHFVRWLCRHGEPTVTAADFASRYRYGAYLADTLGRAVIAAQGTVRVRRLRSRVVDCHWSGGLARLQLADGTAVDAAGVVLATGPTPSSPASLPSALRAGDRFIADPWAPGALDAPADEGRRDDVLLIGTGLTAVDVALRLGRFGRTVYAVSRNGRLPEAHAVSPLPAAACTEPLRDLPLPELRATIHRHIGRVMRAQGDWRPALDGLRPHTAEVWASLTAEERAEFLRRDGSLWNTHRHRMPPATAESVHRMRRTRRLRTGRGRITDVRTLPDGALSVSFTDGRELRVGWVVDCTGPGLLLADTPDPLWRTLLRRGEAVPGPLGIGVSTAGGRLRGRDGRTSRAMWTLGSPRRGELWETTAIPEIRAQAVAVAEAVLAERAPLASGAAPARQGVRRPTDGGGLPLSTHHAAAAAYRSGVDRLLKVRAGAQEALRRAVALDPGFTAGHAALALIGHECGADVDVPRALAEARRCARERADERERSFVEVVSRRVEGSPAEGDAALLRHLDSHPGDRLALAAAVPTIAFSGLYDLDGSAALRVVERTAPAHEGHWFHTSLLAFVRQEQGRYDEAGTLAEQALGEEPASGHAMHALAHVHYEQGDHPQGRDRLDAWLGGHGRGGTHRAHFAWHAALHELASDDAEAVRRRWATHLSPGKVAGIRALVDSGSLLWRARMAGHWQGRVPVDDVLESVAADVLERPATAFTALHAAVTLTAAGDLPGLRRLQAHALGADSVQRAVIAPLCEAFAHVVEENWAEAAQRLERVLPALRAVGGSAAQREVVEETLVYALISAGRCDAARTRLAERLDRRFSPYDRRRLATLPS
ncbi:lycopene cyclase [Streptomyces coelicolor]|uniref:Lycopene cyclase n=1 Tax=Streptomyces toyocaensis TaxID=55952 RepID=Q8KIP3_STRTO|nr:MULTISPECIES: FAD/NAD(P)-binding protein [Streptomyces]AAM80544.1 StaR [Streptomyces toyocaensis]KES08702.1 lycopene cyclase [Streptomyces toyocaensis]NSL78870.1 lycopene cyclase [Streptomyces coelicolor]QKN67438.1 lycopene cyclase [Streptomyces coelicolor]